MLHELLGGRITRLDEGSQRVEVVEQKVRVELALQGVELGLGTGASQLVGAVGIGFSLLKKVKRFVHRLHHGRGQ